MGRKKLETTLDTVISFRVGADEAAFGRAAAEEEYRKSRVLLPLNGWGRAAFVRGAEQVLGITLEEWIAKRKKKGPHAKPAE